MKRLKIDFCLDFIIVIPKLKNLTELQLVDVDENTFEDIELNDALPCNSMPQLSTFVFVNREDESLAHCVVAFGKASPNLKTVKLQLSCQTYSASTFQEIISNFSNLEIFQFHLWGSHLQNFGLECQILKVSVSPVGHFLRRLFAGFREIVPSSSSFKPTARCTARLVPPWLKLRCGLKSLACKDICISKVLI